MITKNGYDISQVNHIFVLIINTDGTIDTNPIPTDKQIEKLNNSPHYMVCDKNTFEQRHGLGLLIVKQIISVHGGVVNIGHSPYGGFSVVLTLPLMQLQPFPMK